MGKFLNVYENVSATSHSGMVAWSTVNSKGLREYLLNKSPEGFLADPVFEATFPYVQSALTMNDLPANGILSQRLVRVLRNAEGDFKFPGDRRPYAHQVQAWECLNDGKSAVISSGTGSGKTECFLFPIFDSLFRQMDESNTNNLVGVQALVLYPMNALINSQKKRLSAWSKSGDKRVRYCLYNRLLEERHDDQAGSEVTSRIALRNSPPPIMMTNTSMLEHMLVRSEDRPILDQSNGKLRWIVLDEAHTYIGSKSADLALLLRRTLIAFGVKVADVQFIATSATISGEGAEDELRNFLADVGGVEPAAIQVVTSSRDFPNQANGIQNAVEERDITVESMIANHVRNVFLEQQGKQPKGVVTLSQVVSKLDHNGVRVDNANQCLSLIDQCCSLKNVDGTNFLPLRAHYFHRLMDGLWACSNGQCALRQLELTTTDANWPFGQVFDELRKECDCGCLVYELAFCSGCGGVVLESQRVLEGETYYLPVSRGDVSKYSFDLIEEVDQDDANDAGATDFVRLAGQPSQYCNPIPINLTNGLSTDEVETNLYIARVEDADTTCCPHCYSKDTKGFLFKGFSIGAPYFISAIMPEVLSQVDPLQNSNDCPSQGRRALCFNDSRSGTASLALRGHSESERQFVRALTYHKCVEAQIPDNVVLQIKEYEGHLAEAEGNRVLRQFFEAQLLALRQPRPLRYEDFAVAMRQSFTTGFLRRYYENLTVSPTWLNDDDHFPFVMFAREFARLPLRANTVETLGLVSVVYLPLLNATSVPTVVHEHFSLDQWKEYLQTVVDMTFRTVGAIDTRGINYRELSMPTYGKSYCHVDPENQVDKKRYNRWPQVRTVHNPNRLVLITAVELALQLDVQAITENRDLINLVLSEAWNVIRNSGLVRRDDNVPDGLPAGYRLDLRKCGLAVSDKYNLCPVTRKAVRPVRNEFTPYLRLGDIEEFRVTQFDIPVFRRVDGNDSKEFLTSDVVLRNRQHGIWSIFQDRIIADLPYFETVEHSAGVQREILDQYEILFDEGKVNVLNCSTTMEMGVDIPGVQAVVMNNVPPHPANYLQRTGRAGRRGEAQAIALTMCRSNPHELSVFSNPCWPFITNIPAPIVRMDSISIVERHVNALLLQQFINQRRREDPEGVDKLKCEVFFRSSDDNAASVEPSLIQRFTAWLSNGNVAIDLVDDYQYLVRGTCLEHTKLPNVMRISSDGVQRIASEWLNRYSELTEQISDLQQDASTAMYAVMHDLDRHSNESLMVYLTNKAWLPVHGFPTSIATFDTTNQNTSQTAAEKRDLVSRNSSVALREYAPGSEVVQAGNVYMSAGLSMNWRKPANLLNVESQNIYEIAVCQSCGDVSISNEPGQGGCTCRSRAKRLKAIEPIGYAVDYSRNPLTVTHPHRRLFAQSTFVKSETAFIPLFNPNCGNVRISPEAKVFTISQPSEDSYFELCLGCGRMAGFTGQGHLNDVHNKLRSDRRCESPLIWSDNNLVLTATNTSSALELRLAKGGMFLTHNTLDTKISKTLGTALLHAMAEILGVDRRELRFMCTRGNPTSIVLFDEGVSGYVSTFHQQSQFIKLFSLAKKKLECPANCQSACSHCLIDFGNRWDTAELDRKVTLDWLTDEWIEELSQEPIQNPSLQVTDLASEILSRVRMGIVERVRLFGNLSTRGGDLIASAIPVLVTDLLKTGVSVDLIFDENPEGMEPSDIRRLSGLLETFSQLLKVGHDLKSTNPLHVVAEIQRSSESYDRFSCGDATGCIVDETWGANGISLDINRSDRVLSYDNVTWIDTFDLLPQGNPDLGLFYISGKRDTPEGIAQKMIDKVLTEVPSVKTLLESQPIVSLEYSDRYLRTPMSAAILVCIHKKLASLHSPAQLRVITRRVVERDKGSKFEFISDEERASYVTRLWNANNLACELVLSKDTRHERYLLLETADGQRVTVLIDGGLSFWDYVVTEQDSMRADRQANQKTLESTQISSRFEESEMPVVIRMSQAR